MTSRESATASTIDPTATLGPGHEHGWVTESKHATSLGEVRYIRCPGCGVRRIDLLAPGELLPEAASRVTPSAGD
jgi:allantoicase